MSPPINAENCRSPSDGQRALAVLRPRTSCGASCRCGFTLIETIAAIVILAVAVPAMLWTLHEAHHHRVDPVLTSRACWLATEKLEDIIADRFSPTRGFLYLTPANYPDESSVDQFPGFSRKVEITETGSDLETAGSGYLVATVIVEWTGSRRQARRLEISTVLTNY